MFIKHGQEGRAKGNGALACFFVSLEQKGAIRHLLVGLFLRRVEPVQPQPAVFFAQENVPLLGIVCRPQAALQKEGKNGPA